MTLSMNTPPEDLDPEATNNLFWSQIEDAYPETIERKLSATLCLAEFADLLFGMSDEFLDVTRGIKIVKIISLDIDGDKVLTVKCLDDNGEAHEYVLDPATDEVGYGSVDPPTQN